MFLKPPVCNCKVFNLLEEHWS
uniref:Uncharacterized protein n=1 Tax=Anguilla anguilla TaxID=7936 RepID=A0A0E9Q1U3_ANGAN